MYLKNKGVIVSVFFVNSKKVSLVKVEVNCCVWPQPQKIDCGLISLVKCTINNLMDCYNDWQLNK